LCAGFSITAGFAGFGFGPAFAFAHDGNLELGVHVGHHAQRQFVDAQVADRVLQLDAAAVHLEAHGLAQLLGDLGSGD